METEIREKHFYPIWLIQHGYAKSGAKRPEYNIWCALKSRCGNPKNKRYDRYGGRGIRVCDRWLNGEAGMSAFQCFIADMGDRPSDRHQIERVDNDADYAPQNCRWATPEEQQANTSRTRYVEFNGERLTLTQACRKYGLNNQMIRNRLSRGWSEYDALHTPPDLKRQPERIKSLYEEAS